PDTPSVSGSDTRTYAGEVSATVFFVKGTVSYKQMNGHSFVEAGLIDVDGDGLPDRVLRTGQEDNAGIQVQLNQFDGANLLKTVHRPLGGRIVLDYEQNTPSEDDPNARWLLTSFVLEHEDSFPAEHQTASLSQTFEYEGPYYDRFERE